MQEMVLVQNKAFQFQLSGIETVRMNCNNFNLEQVVLIHKTLPNETGQFWVATRASAPSLTTEAA